MTLKEAMKLEIGDRVKNTSDFTFEVWEKFDLVKDKVFLQSDDVLLELKISEMSLFKRV